MPPAIQNTQATAPVVQVTTFLPADTTTAKSIQAAQLGPWHLIDILVTSTDTAAQVVDFFVHIGATNTLLASLSIPAGSGVAGVKPVSLVDFLSLSSMAGLDFHGQATLQAGMEATITAAKVITVTLFYADY